MSTPHMSGRTDAPTTTTRDVSDLLTDGKVDISKVRSITNAASGTDAQLTEETCADLRERVLSSQHATQTASTFGIGSTACRRHAKGECHHAENCVDHPPLAFERGEGWRVDE